MPIAAAAPVLVFIPISCSASPRTRVMSSPGRASEPTARIQHDVGADVDRRRVLELDQREIGRLHRRGRRQRGAARATHHAEREQAERPPQPGARSRVITASPPRPRRSRRPSTRPCPWPGRARRATRRCSSRSPVVSKSRTKLAVTPRGWPSGGEDVEPDPAVGRGRRVDLVGDAGAAEEVEVALGVGGGVLGERRERRREVRARELAEEGLVEPGVDHRCHAGEDLGLAGRVARPRRARW